MKSFRITDIEPTVDAADPRAFPVRLAFWNGTEPTRAASFSIRPAVRYQPDNLIGSSRKRTRAKGNGIYNRTGARQTLRVVSSCRRRVSAYLTVQNDGEGPDRFRLRGPGGNRSLKIAYFSGGNRTALVRRGNYRTPALNPNATKVVRVELRALSESPFRRKLRLLTRSGSDATKADLAAILFRHR